MRRNTDNTFKHFSMRNENNIKEEQHKTRNFIERRSGLVYESILCNTLQDVSCKVLINLPLIIVASKTLGLRRKASVQNISSWHTREYIPYIFIQWQFTVIKRTSLF